MAGWAFWIGGTMASGGIVSGATDYSEYTDFASWRFYLSNRQRGSHGVGKMIIPTGAIARPKGFQMIVVQDSAGNNVFAGQIQRVDQKGIQPGVYEYTLQVSDLTRWLDHMQVGPVAYPTYANEDIADVVSQIIADWVNPGNQVNTYLGVPAGQKPNVPITTNHVVATGVTLYYYNANYLPVSQVIDYLAHLANCVWFVDWNGDLWFIPSQNEALYAPLPTQSITYYNQQEAVSITEVLPTLNADSDISHYHDLVLSEDVSTTISAVTARDFLMPSTTQQNESQSANPALVGDGTTRVFSLNQQPVNNIDYMTVTATIGGVVTTFSAGNGNLGLEYVNGQPSDGAIPNLTCYINTDGSNIRFNGPSPLLGAPDSGTAITVVYNYFMPGFDFQYPPNAIYSIIAAREGYGPGYYFDVLADPTLTSPISIANGTPAYQAAELLDLQRYGIVRLLADFHSYTYGWYPGQVFAIVSTDRGDVADTTDTAFTGWGTTFANRFFVNQVTIALLNDDTIDYEIQASSDIWGP